MKKSSQTGFALVEGLLIVVIVVAVAFAGWYVWHSGKTTPPQAATATTAKTTPKATTPAVDPTKDWIAYTSSTGKFSLRYPTTWSTATHTELCDSRIFLLGPSAQTVGKCGSDDVGQVVFSSSEGDNRSSYNFDPANYSGITHENVTVQGVAGQKMSGTYTYTGFGIGPVVGAKLVDYIFFTNGTTYQAEYDQAPGAPDALSDFNLIVTKTLKFE